MALQRYSDQFWTPDGVLAANLPVQVFPADSNAFAALFANAAGTIVLPNPGTSTDGAGTLTFWATVGQYWVHIDTQAFLVNVGMSEDQAQLSTGVASGGNIDPAPGPPAVTIAPLIGYIVDNLNDVSVPPTITTVEYPGGTVLLDAGSLSRTITYWLMDGAQNVLQQPNRPTPEQYRESLVLGLSVFDTGSLTVLETQTLPTILPQLANAHVDLADSLGPFVFGGGNEIGPNGPNLMLNKSAGPMFSRAVGYVVAGTVTDNPNIITSPALIAPQFRRILRGASFPTPPAVLTVDPANYDVGGVLTPVPGGPNVSTVQRVYLFAADTVSLRIAVQYGQAAYSTPQLAVASIGAGTKFTPAPVTQAGALIGYLAMTRTCTDLSDPAQATFVYAGRFGTP